MIYNLASVLEQQGQKEEAERLYVKLLARNPEWEDAWFRLGYLRLQRDDYRGGSGSVPGLRPQADAVARGAVEPRPGATGSWARTTKPRRRFKRCWNPIRTSIDAMRGLAAMAVEREDLPKALDLQAKLIESGERTPELFYNTGLLLQKSGQLDDAIKLYQEALTERPNFAEALLNLGHALKAKGAGRSSRILASGAGTEAGAGRRIFRPVTAPPFRTSHSQRRCAASGDCAAVWVYSN